MVSAPMQTFKSLLLIAMGRLGLDAQEPPAELGENDQSRLLEWVPAALAVADDDGTLLQLNPRARRILGPASALIDSVDVSFHGLFRTAFDTARGGGTSFLEALLTTGQSLQFALTRSGRYVFTRLTGEAWLTPADLVRYRAVFEGSRDAVLLISQPDWLVVDASPAAGLLFGLPPAELVGRALGALLPDGKTNDSLLSQGALFQHRRARRADADTRDVEVSACRVQGGQALLHVTLRDLAERRRLEGERESLVHALHQAQKQEALGQLAGGIAHDLRNVLAVVVSFASALKDDVTSPGAREDVEQILEAAQRGHDLSQQLLAFARKEPMRREPVDFFATVRTAARLSGRLLPQKVRLVVDVPDATRELIGDRSQLEQTFLNLVINARDAMPDGGTLTITAIADERRAQLEVRDTGSGMTDDVMKRAFEPFFTTKPRGEGTGLGLAMVYATARGHGGDVRIESRPGEGTTVTLWLPCVPADRPSPLPQAPLVGVALLIDDDENVRFICGALLQKLGFEVHVAGSGDEALTLVKHGLRPRLVVCDLVMPGKSGVETIRELHALGPELTLIVSSGFLDGEELDAALAAGATGVLRKPFTIAEIRRSLGAAGVLAPPSAPG